LDQLPENIKQKVFNNANPTTMTMDEFAEMQQKRMKEEEEKHKEFEKNKSDDDSDKEEVDDKKKKKAREWDDWKDENPKGSGNRMGK
jgi:immunoglobulin-binding protein 1